MAIALRTSPPPVQTEVAPAQAPLTAAPAHFDPDLYEAAKQAFDPRPSWYEPLKFASGASLIAAFGMILPALAIGATAAAAIGGASLIVGSVAGVIEERRMDRLIFEAEKKARALATF